MTLPLENLTVIEASEGVAGAFCGRMLAAFGADVIKIERPPGGDLTRFEGPGLPNVRQSEASALHLHLNMGKRSALLDWQTERGAESLKRLIRDADVLLEDWNAETQERVGLANVVESLNPRLIDLSLTPFGTSGPYSDWATTPLVSLALGGFLYLSGDEDRELLSIPGRQPEYLAGLHGYGGVMIALWERERTGRGRRVSVSEIETLAALHQFTTVMHTYGGVVRSRHGARWENKGNYGRYPITILPCKDGYVSFAVSTEGQWDLLFPMVGQPELLEDPRFQTFAERREHADDIDAILIDWMKDKTREEVFAYAAGDWSEPASPMLYLSETLADEQLVHREFFVEVEHPDAGALTYPTVPFRMSETQPEFGPAPRLGQHTDEVLSTAVQKIPSPSMGEGQGEGVPWNLKEVIGPLSDVRILDLTRVWAGPLATRILADFGAEVIKISDPRVPIDRMGGTNNKLNRNKSNLALRLDHDTGRDAFLELVTTADVVVENFRPRVMRNFDLTYADLREVRPDIVMCSMPGFGDNGQVRRLSRLRPVCRGHDRHSEHDGLRGRYSPNLGARLPRPRVRSQFRSRDNDRSESPKTHRTGAVHRPRADRRPDLPDRRVHRGSLTHRHSAAPCRKLPSRTRPLRRVSCEGRGRMDCDMRHVGFGVGQNVRIDGQVGVGGLREVLGLVREATECRESGCHSRRLDARTGRRRTRLRTPIHRNRRRTRPPRTTSSSPTHTSTSAASSSK